MPKTATTASPMNFSTMPSWYSMTDRISSKYRATTFRSDSVSRLSPSCVEPTKSQKRTETFLRTVSESLANKGLAQELQNLASFEFSCPQVGQGFSYTPKTVAGPPADLSRADEPPARRAVASTAALQHPEMLVSPTGFEPVLLAPEASALSRLSYGDTNGTRL